MKRFVHTAILTIVMTIMAIGDMCASIRPAGMAEKLGYEEGDTAIVIPAFVRELPAYCFAECRGLKMVTFEDGTQIAKISDFVFLGCEELEDIQLPDCIVQIGTGAFRGCESLKTASLPTNIQKISRECFTDCKNLRNVEMPEWVNEIGALAFAGCTRLETMMLPARLKTIKYDAFSHCKSLKDIVIPSACTTIESYVFTDCTSLERIVLPSKCEMLGELLFSGCNNLKEIEVKAFVPPIIECNSTLFEPDDKKAFKQCVIIVPKGRKQAYGQSEFWNKYRITEPADHRHDNS